MPFHICQSDTVQPLSGTFFFLVFFTFFVCLRSRKSCKMNLHRLNINVDIKYDRSVGSFYNLFHMNFNTSKRTNWRIIRHRTPETIPHSQDTLFYTSWHAVWIVMNLTPFTFVCITSGHVTLQGYFPLTWRNRTNHCNLLFCSRGCGLPVPSVRKSVLDPLRENWWCNS